MVFINTFGEAYMYTAALHGSYTGELPPPSSVYTKVISAILNNESLKPYVNKHSELVNYILTVYGEKTIVNKPLSSLTLILSTKVFPERFKTIKYNGEVLIIEDVIENKQNIVVLDNPLERLWAMIINESELDNEWVNFLDYNGSNFITSDGQIFMVKEK